MDISDVLRNDANNDGGFQTILSIIPASDIDVFPGLKAAPATDLDLVTMEVGEITAKVGKRWTKIETNIEKIGNKLSSEGSVGSLNLVNSPTITLDNLTDKEYAFLVGVLNKPVVIGMKDLLGKQPVYGTPELPAYITEASGDSGTAVSDDKSLTITVRSISPAAFYAGGFSYVAVV